ncbi:MAG: FeoB-associated Cys-rich membrane protein [Oscillospiraceae bacterium]|nr:FeoB-associated Cys-rich membrane protein [Oscillospiraceae bacterium]
MQDIMLLAVIGLIVGAAAGYIWREKRKGRKCIGCPDSAACSGHCVGCSGCGNKTAG